MTERLRRLDQHGDEGLTLVEMVVALFLVTLVLTSFVSVAIAGASASRAAEYRNRATQIGNQEIENDKSLAWTSLGLYDNDTSLSGATVAATCGTSEPAVSLGSTAPTPRVAPALQRSVTVNGRTFTVTTCVTWRDDPADGTYAGGDEADSDQGHDIKHTVVTVSWRMLGKTRSVSFDSLRTPTALEVPPTAQHTTATLSLTASSPSPSTVQLAADYSLSTSLTLQVSASIPASNMTASYADRTGNKVQNLVTSDGGTTWTYTFPAGASGGTWNPGSTTFTFYGTSASGNATATTTGSFTAPPTPFTVSSSASPTSVSLNGSGQLNSSITLTATTSVAASAVTVNVPQLSGSTTVNMTSTNGGNSWTYTIPAGAPGGMYSPTNNELLTFSAISGSNSITSTSSIVLTQGSSAVTITGVSIAEYSGQICDASGNKLKGDQTVVITAQNVSTGDTASVSWTNQSGTSSVAKQAATSSGGTVTFYVKIPANTTFNKSTTSIIATVKRTTTDNTSASSTAATFNVTNAC